MSWLVTILGMVARLPVVTAIILMVGIGTVLLGVGCAGQLLKLPFGGGSVQECAALVHGLGADILGITEPLSTRE